MAKVTTGELERLVMEKQARIEELEALVHIDPEDAPLMMLILKRGREDTSFGYAEYDVIDPLVAALTASIEASA
jgi:hypothetical protein